MNIYDIVDSETVLNDAFEDKKLKVTPRTKNLPTIKDAQKVVLEHIENNFVAEIAKPLAPALQSTVDNYILLNGEFDASDERNEWLAGLDDQVEAVIENYVPFLSADWLGNNMDNTGIHEENGVDHFARSLGREFFKELTYKKKPGQTLSNANITVGEIEKWLEEHIEAGRGKNTAVEDEDDAVRAVMGKIRAYLGTPYDVLEVYEDLDLASDEETILAEGAAPRLGLDSADLEVLQDVRKEHKSKTADVLFDKLRAIDEEGAAEEKQEKKDRKKERDVKKDEMKGVSAEPLRALKECGAKDTDMCEALGVSRSTYSSWVKRESIELEDEQIEIIKNELISRAELLNTALELL